MEICRCIREAHDRGEFFLKESKLNTELTDTDAIALSPAIPFLGLFKISSNTRMTSVGYKILSTYVSAAHERGNMLKKLTLFTGVIDTDV